MITIILFLFFFGAFLVMNGIFKQKTMDVERTTRVEYRFIPRTLYEEQMDSTGVSSNLRPMFENADPSIGGGTTSQQIRASSS